VLIRDPIETAYFFSLRAGDTESANKVQPFVGRPDRPGKYSPLPWTLNGKELKLPFDDPHYADRYPSKPEDMIGSAAVMDLRILATMWIYGGSETWPQARIEQQVTTTLEKLYALPGWEPW
jgi:hypothetical protein